VTFDDGVDWVIQPAPRPALAVAGTAARFPVHRIYCVGQNYRAHAQEMGASGREPPFFFCKPADAISQAATLPYPSMTRELHHEVELVVALGSAGRDVAPANALSLVFGYGVGVDLTRRDLQAVAKKAGRPWATSKGFDNSAAMSPVQPVGLCGHPADAVIRLAVNGQLRQQGSTADMIWSVPEIIAELSRYFELQAGDLIFTGTPPGVAPLQHGDQVECEITGIARLEFRVAD